MCLKGFQRTTLSLYPQGSEHESRLCGLTAAQATLGLLSIGTTSCFSGFHRRETMGSKLLVVSLVGFSR